MGVETIARRYASALADVAVSAGETESVKSELHAWDQLIRTNPDLESAFLNPSIAHMNKERLLENLIQRTSPSKTVGNFLRVLLQNSRLNELPEIVEKLDRVIDERNGIVSGSVTSARQLSDDQKKAFAETLSKQTGKDVRLTFDTDNGLIGGAVTRVGSTVFDGSVRSQLDHLKDQMIKV